VFEFPSRIEVSPFGCQRLPVSDLPGEDGLIAPTDILPDFFLVIVIRLSGETSFMARHIITMGTGSKGVIDLYPVLIIREEMVEFSLLEWGGHAIME
jgi:hypothetical protein